MYRFAVFLGIVLVFVAANMAQATLVIDDFTPNQAANSGAVVGGGAGAGGLRTLDDTNGDLSTLAGFLVLDADVDGSGNVIYGFEGIGGVDCGTNDTFSFNGAMNAGTADWDWTAVTDSGVKVAAGSWATGAALTMPGPGPLGVVSTVTFHMEWATGSSATFSGEQLTAVPEPSSLVLSGIAAIGMAGLAFQRIRRRKKEEATA